VSRCAFPWPLARTMTDGIERYFGTLFTYEMPMYSPNTDPTKERILASLSDRMTKGIWAEGRGYCPDQGEVRRAVNRFLTIHLKDKTLQQLQVIEALPALPITPGLLSWCGLIDLKPSTTRPPQHIIYLKFVIGDATTLANMRRSPRDTTASIAQRSDSFLSSGLSPDILAAMAQLGVPVDLLVMDPTCPPLFHVGRALRGSEGRRGTELRDVREYDPSCGARAWVESMVYSPGQAAKVIYFPVVAHDDKCGELWTYHMVSCPSLFSQSGD
jgi:hypothetical protein